MGFNGIYHLGMSSIAIENGKVAIEIVSLPIMNCDFPIVMLEYQRVPMIHGGLL